MIHFTRSSKVPSFVNTADTCLWRTKGGVVCRGTILEMTFSPCFVLLWRHLVADAVLRENVPTRINTLLILAFFLYADSQQGTIM